MGDSTIGYPEPTGYHAEIAANPDTLGEPRPLTGWGAAPGGDHTPPSVTGGAVDARPLKRTLSLNKRVNVVQGVAAAEDLGFVAHSVIIDNYSGQWLFEGAARRWVPPATTGTVIRFPSGSQVLSVMWTAPPGVTQPTGTAGTSALFIYCEDMLDESSGSPLGSAAPGVAATTVTGTATPSDATANPTTAVATEDFNMVWNPVELQWEREITAESDAMGDTGLLASGNMVSNGATWDRLAEFAAALAVYTGVAATGLMLSNGAGTAPVKSATQIGDGQGTNSVPVAGAVYNGTNWDRMRGSNKGATGALAVTEAVPTAANIASGFANSAVTATTTLVTIPTGRTWVGYVGCSACQTVVAGTATAGTVSSAITTAVGTGTPTPTAGTYMRVDANTAANAATGTVGGSNAAAATGQRMVVQAAGGTALIQSVITVANGSNPQASGWAIGELL